jgi:hypothetical protein
MAGAHNLSRAHNNIGIVVPDYQASGFLLNRAELLDPEAEDVAIEKFTLLQICNREGEDKTHRTDISMSILMLSQKDRNCLAKAYGAHSKGHDCLEAGPSMAVRLSPSMATDALAMGTISPCRLKCSG